MQQLNRLWGFGRTSKLAGTRLVRLTYLDEAGTSAHEPIAVVAGVIVHGDAQLAPVEDHLQSLTERFIPPPDRADFVFHATDIWSGTKYFKNRDVWPLEKRMEMLTALAEIPAKFSIPIAHGTASKDRIRSEIGAHAANKLVDVVSHACAYSSATQMVERCFREMFADEYTIIIAEDRDVVRRMLKSVQKVLQGKGSETLPQDLLRDISELPYRHIKDTVHFAGKRESPLLQVADVCAFLLRGVLSGHPQAPTFFRLLTPVLLAPARLRLGVLPT